MEPRRHPAIGHPQRRAAKNIAVGDLVDIHCQGGRGWYLPVESITRRRKGVLAIRVAPCPHWPRSANTIPARTLVLGPRQMVDTWEGRSLTREWIDNPHSPSIHRDSRGGVWWKPGRINA